MKKTIVASKGFTKKMSISLSASGISMKDLKDNAEIKLSAAALVEDTDIDTGEVKKVAAFVDQNGNIYSSISANAIDVTEDIVSLLDDGEEVTVRLLKRKSKAGRDFLSLVVI